MGIVSPETVRIGGQASDKADAIRQAGDLLVQGGCVESGYVDGMLARESTMSTYLGNGVAIPHGQNANRAQIRRTGISVLQLPGGVEWEPGEQVYLVIGIAASADEHVGVLSNLAEIIEDPDMAMHLARVTDPHEIVQRLNG
ncbi:MAG TPA: PTS sugar transporter subunit IIA [Herpetosiphonaceae bacterium]